MQALHSTLEGIVLIHVAQVGSIDTTLEQGVFD